MTLKKFTERINGRQYLNELTDEDIQIAKENGFLIIYGYSDDNVEVDGIFRDEFGAYNGTTVFYRPSDKSVYESEDSREGDIEINCLWCAEDSEFTWSFKTSLIHETFEIYDGDEKFCLGIVIDINNI